MPPKKKAQFRGTAVSAPPPASTREPRIPTPFERPDPALQPFLDGLDVTHLYITHVDRHPRKLKRNIFIVPILLNMAVLGLVIWRLKYIAPYYSALIMTFLGYSDSPTSIDAANTPWPELINAVFNRTGTLFVDFAILRFLAPWPYDFFVGDRSPSYWRATVGFRDEEIVVRRSRRWDKNLPDGWLAAGDPERDGSSGGGGGKKKTLSNNHNNIIGSANADGDGDDDDDGPGAEVWKERILPAVDRHWVRAKTGYLMMDKSWDLDFLAMTVATNMCSATDAGGLAQEHFEKTLLAYSTPQNGWLAWPVHRLDGEGDDGEGEGGGGGAGGSSAEQRRKKLVLFKDRLTALGKESLFFRWIEIVQFESSRPGGFTPDRQQAAMRQAKEAFEAEGVDFEKFWESVGGMEGLPGWEGKNGAQEEKK